MDSPVRVERPGSINIENRGCQFESIVCWPPRRKCTSPCTLATSPAPPSRVQKREATNRGSKCPSKSVFMHAHKDFNPSCTLWILQFDQGCCPRHAFPIYLVSSRAPSSCCHRCYRHVGKERGAAEHVGGERCTRWGGGVSRSAGRKTKGRRRGLIAE